MIKILLLGSGGQLGQELLALAPLHDITLVSHARSGVDIADEAAVAKAFGAARPDLAVNAGAYTKVDKAESEKDEAFRANETGPAVLGRVSAAHCVPIVHFSTDYVFDGSKHGPYHEEDPIAPIGVYGASKAAGEVALRKANSRHLILRTSWVYGIYGNNFLKTILRLARERDKLSVVDDQLGCPTSTADLADAVLRLAPVLTNNRASWGTYHFAGSGATSWYRFACEIVAQQAHFTGREPPVTPIPTSAYPTPARRPANSELDSSRFAAAFGFRARRWQDRTAEAVATLCG